jgi:hypothetical protein
VQQHIDDVLRPMMIPHRLQRDDKDDRSGPHVSGQRPAHPTHALEAPDAGGGRGRDDGGEKIGVKRQEQEKDRDCGDERIFDLTDGGQCRRRSQKEDELNDQPGPTHRCGCSGQ